MAFIMTIAETRTDPKDINLIVDVEEILEAVTQIYKDEGIMPDTITLIDECTEEDIEIDVAEYIDLEDLVTIEGKWADPIEEATE